MPFINVLPLIVYSPNRKVYETFFVDSKDIYICL